MEGVVIQSDFWRGKRVFVTGHTGFKGGWLCLWLQSMGAETFGYSLAPPTEPNLFTVASVGVGMKRSVISDIRDATKLLSVMQDARPEIVFHLAAQPLVRYSYDYPTETFAVNVIGTVNVLEAVRATPSVRAVVNVTTDKCYDNRESVLGYQESDPLGGFDPYSSSKACSELVTAAYRHSFMERSNVALASARAGNVIGGGDWATDRLVPDFLRAMDSNKPLQVRAPDSIRPWQHVLEPVAGYLLLGEHLLTQPKAYAEPWNFGPDQEDIRSVRWIVEHLEINVPNVVWQLDQSPKPHETNILKLDSSKARTRLNWRPKWRLQKALASTIAWHRAWRNGDDMRKVTLAQVADYQRNTAT